MEVQQPAVGPISRGIQVCQELLSHYNDEIHSNPEMRSTYRDIAILSDTLRLLKGTFEGVKVDGEGAKQIKTCLQSFEGDIRKLVTRRRKMQMHRSLEATQDHASSPVRGYLHLFRMKGLLREIRAIVAEVQKHSSLAFQVVQLVQAEQYRKTVHLLACGADLNVQGGYYGNALQAISFGGRISEMQMLLDKGANVNAQGGYFGSALQAASYNGHLEAMRLLLDHGAEINTPGGHYDSALQAASSRGFLKAVQLLLDKGADVNAQGGYFGNALQAASSSGHLEAMQLLLHYNADLNVQSEGQRNAIQAASYGGHTKAIQLLPDCGANVDAHGGEHGNALYTASERGHKKTLHLLLEKGADVNSPGGEYGNPLQAASVIGDMEVVQSLLDRGANPRATGGIYSTALHAASSQAFPDVVQLLIRHGADVEARSESFETPLQVACVTRATEMATLLLHLGANPNAAPGSHGTCLRAAVLSEADEIVRQLLRNGAELSEDIPQNNVLFVASRAGSKHIIRILLENGILPNLSALEKASEEGHSQVVDLLILAGAVASTRNTQQTKSILPHTSRSSEQQILDTSDDDLDVQTHAESVFSSEKFSVTTIPTTLSSQLHQGVIQRKTSATKKSVEPENSFFRLESLRNESADFPHILSTRSFSTRDPDNTDTTTDAHEEVKHEVIAEEPTGAVGTSVSWGTALPRSVVSTVRRRFPTQTSHDHDMGLRTTHLAEVANVPNHHESLHGETICTDATQPNVADGGSEIVEQLFTPQRFVFPSMSKLHQAAIHWCRPRLPNGFSRLEWSCSCGQSFWGDFQHTKREDLDRLISDFRRNGLQVRILAASDATAVHGDNARPQDINLTSGSSQCNSNNVNSATKANAQQNNGSNVLLSQAAKTSFLHVQRPVYLELCINRSSMITRLGEIMLVPGRGDPLIRTDQQLFDEVRSKYEEHKRRHLFAFLWRPCDIHYVRFGYQVAARQLDVYQKPEAIPPCEEVDQKRYHYFESPLKTLPPMPKQTFYQYFHRHEPGCASRSSLFCDRLPKKLGASMVAPSGADELAFGWGLHIIEGPNKPVLAALVAIIVFVSFVVAVLYDIVTRNKDSGFAIGQWMCGVLSALLAAVYFHFQEK